MSFKFTGDGRTADLTGLTKEPTGFVETTTGDLADIDVSHDATARTITLTGTFKAYYQGVEVVALVTGWESDAYAAGITSNRYLHYDGAAFSWDSVIDLSKLSIASVLADATAIRFAVRECHGLMQWQAHQEAHDTIGTYRKSGGDLSNYTAASTVAANRRPDTSLCILDDEDLPSDLPAQLSSETYTLMYLTLTDTINFVTASDDITRLNVAVPYWNEYTGGAWTDAAMSNNFYAAWFQLAVPTTSETGSQTYRFIWIQPQSQSLSLSSIRAVTTGDLDLGTLATMAPELIFINKVIMQYTAADWKITEIEALTGTSKNQIGISGGGLSSVSVDGITVDGNGTPSDPLELTGLIKPQADGTSAVQITKTDGVTAVVTVDTTNSQLGIGTAAPAQKFEALDTSGIQARFTHTAGSVYTDVGTTSAGGYNILPSAAKTYFAGDTILAEQADIISGVSYSDFGMPTIVAFFTNGTNYTGYNYSGIQSNGVVTNTYARWGCRMISSLSAGNVLSYDYASNIGMTDTNGEQSFFYIRPSVRQSGTASYTGLRVNATETSIGDGSTGDGNNLFWLGVSDTNKFIVKNDGKVGINTTTPDTKFHVADTVTQMTISYTEGSVESTWTTGAGGITTLATTGNSFVFPGGTDNNPAVAFGDGDSGFYETSDDIIAVSIAGNLRYTFNDLQMGVSASRYPVFYRQEATATVPNILPDSLDTDTGLGGNAADQLSLIAGGNEIQRNTWTGTTGQIDLKATIVMLASLPTSDPTNAGQLWNNAGIVTVSAG